MSAKASAQAKITTITDSRVMVPCAFMSRCSRRALRATSCSIIALSLSSVQPASKAGAISAATVFTGRVTGFLLPQGPGAQGL